MWQRVIVWSQYTSSPKGGKWAFQAECVPMLQVDSSSFNLPSLHLRATSQVPFLEKHGKPPKRDQHLNNSLPPKPYASFTA